MTYSEWLRPALISCLWLDIILFGATIGLNIIYPSDFRRLFRSIRDNILRDKFANVLLTGGLLALIFTELTAIVQSTYIKLFPSVVGVCSVLIPIGVLDPKLREWFSSSWRLRVMVFSCWSAIGASLFFIFFTYIGWLPFTAATYIQEATHLILSHPFDSLFIMWESGMLYAEMAAFSFAIYAACRFLKMIFTSMK